MPSELPHLPKEIVMGEIIPRLPVKSLVRFQRVSKSWCAAISDPKFPLANALPRVAILTKEVGRDKYSLSIKDDKSSSAEVLTTYKWKKIPESCLRLLSSYNGLLLFLCPAPSDHIILLNPSTAQSTYFNIHTYLHDHYVFTAGMFHNFATNTYNFAIGISPWNSGIHAHQKLRIVDCKEKTHKDFPFPYYPRHSCLVLDDKLHWLVFKNVGKLIISFDPLKFRLVELPLPVPKNDDEIILSLMVMDGQLAIARKHNFRFSPNEGVIELVIMKQYGVKESWTVLFTFRNFYYSSIHGNFEPLFFTREGNMVIRTGDRIFVYSIEQDRCHDIFVKGLYVCEGAVALAESLFWPPDIPKRNCYKRTKRGILGVASSSFQSLFCLRPTVLKLAFVMDRL